MKKVFILIGILMLPLALSFSNGTKESAASGVSSKKFHIGIVTETVSQAEDNLRGAEELIKRYGAVKDGGMIQHITYPDDFMSQQETTISQIVALADDPLIKAIIVNQGVPGTAEAFKRVKEKRSDILCFAGEPHEDPLVIESSADLAINADFVSRGYTIIWAAKQMGAKSFVHISFPRHMSYETLGTRRQIMEQACADLGLRFVFETAPDPTSDVGVAGAQQFILEKVPQWVEKYGKETAFFCTNDAHTEPLLKQIAKYGGMFVEADLPSPLMGYPGAFGIDLSSEAGNFPAILKKVESVVVANNGAGRFGTWAYSYGFTVSAGLGEFAKRIIEGTAKLESNKDLFDSLAVFTPGAKWNGANYIDQNTGVRSKNHMLIYMDTYVFGKGYLPTTQQEVPEKYFKIKFANR
ncbi:DUF3798 domain-containing protein [Treponema parvum]|uniref:DUF3798 domain-containing protein n=1 Tax=Treponema parvum TaxID=138851 RepID=UPI001AEC598E|nr:DUF3798 domain-containing protein [Treponema parvum]QTQ16846.1 DUF3798 domain-containing protein [Treponema parvum]